MFRSVFIKCKIEKTPYEGGTFKIKLVLPSDFPSHPPKGRILLLIFKFKVIFLRKSSTQIFRNPVKYVLILLKKIGTRKNGQLSIYYKYREKFKLFTFLGYKMFINCAIP